MAKFARKANGKIGASTTRTVSKHLNVLVSRKLVQFIRRSGKRFSLSPPENPFLINTSAVKLLLSEIENLENLNQILELKTLRVANKEEKSAKSQSNRSERMEKRKAHCRSAFFRWNREKFCGNCENFISP